MPMEEEEQPTATTSLFPAFVHHPPLQVLPIDSNNTAAAAGKWLNNSSFTTDISVINDAVSKYSLPYEEEREEEEEEEGDKVEDIRTSKRPPQYEMVPSSPSGASASSGEEHSSKRKKKKKRRRKEEFRGSRPLYEYAASLSSSSRKQGVQKWASSSTSNEKEYYFDSRGDRDNLAFGCIYR